MSRPTPSSLNTFKTQTELQAGAKKLKYHSLKNLEASLGKSIATLPFSIRVLIENLLRFEDGVTARKEDIQALVDWNPKSEPDKEIQFRPARIVLQDFTGVPAVADLAAMRGALKRLGGDAKRINPLQPADLVIDHSVQVDFFGTKDAFKKNAQVEFDRNRERYQFLRWGQKAFQNFRVVPPDTGIVHQVNLEFLSHVAMTMGEWIYPDTLVGTDSHTTMINGLGVVGWGVGGIEAEAAMLGQPITMLIPQVVGFRLTGKLSPGTTATDLVLTATEMLRKKGVVGKFVEFFGPGMSTLPLADRATLANMAPEYGATIGFFPVDEQTCAYLKLTGREKQAETVEAYYKAQGLWYSPTAPDCKYTDVLELELSKVEPSLAGPSRPQDRVSLSGVSDSFKKTLPTLLKDPKAIDAKREVKDPNGNSYTLENGSIVITAITSCTNTSNPALLITAGLLAKKAVEKGLKSKPWVKTSLAPGSKVVTDYLVASDLMPSLEALGFHLVGYGCTTCIGNSGPVAEHIATPILESGMTAAAVLSGNRNFEGRIHPTCRANYLASPPLVVAYSIAGNVNVNLTKDPLGFGKDGKPVFLKDIWPTPQEVDEMVRKTVNAQLFTKSYSDVFGGDDNWKSLKIPDGDLYVWDSKSTYIKEPPFFATLTPTPPPVKDIQSARVLALLGDSVTTDHISPAGDISKKGDAGLYLMSLGVDPKDFNSFGARRGNHEVMIRGTFGNTRIKNKLCPGTEGPLTKYFPNNEVVSIYTASQLYQKTATPLVILAGKEYGTGSSRDWAAKGTMLLGIKAVIAESFERIHRSNLVGMGVLPLQFLNGEGAPSLGLDGSETFDFEGLTGLAPGQKLRIKAKKTDGSTKEFFALVRVDTPNELSYYKHGGILQFVLRQTLK